MGVQWELVFTGSRVRRRLIPCHSCRFTEGAFILYALFPPLLRADGQIYDLLVFLAPVASFCSVAAAVLTDVLETQSAPVNQSRWEVFYGF